MSNQDPPMNPSHKRKASSSTSNDDTRDSQSSKNKRQRYMPRMPEKIETIRDLIDFAYAYTGENVDLERLHRLVPILRDLDRLVGMKKVKQTILELVMFFLEDFNHINEEYLHTVIVGPAGCGKTTVARIIGRIYAALGILTPGHFVQIDRTQFVGKYLGQTSHRTMDTLKKYRGCVVFIDEAYSLAPRRKDSDSYAKEMLDALNKYLSEHKHDFVCIIAGYEEELNKTFFAMNPGLRRRFPWKFVIDSYNGAELLEIFKDIVYDAYWYIESGAINADFFERNKEYFSNYGGDVETFFTKCKFAHIRRVFGQNSPDKTYLNKQDIEAGFKKHQEHQQRRNDQPPAGIYT